MIVLKGAEVSARIKEEVHKILAGWEKEAPKLAIVRVGENPDDMSYERGAKKKLESFGLRVQSYAYPLDISDGEFKKAFQAINADDDVTGILLLRPLPGQICGKDIEQMIDPDKDLDGISPVNIAKVFAGDESGIRALYGGGSGGGVKTEGYSNYRKKSGDCGAQHGGGKASFHADVKGKCHSHHLPYPNQGSDRNLSGG